MPRRPATDHAKIHLPLYGEEREISAEVRLGRATLGDLLPPAREISRQIAALALAQAEAEGRSMSCRPGCAACCRQLVPVAPVEAVALSQVVSSMPGKRQAAVRRRFAAAVARMEQLGLLDPAAPKGRYALQSAAAPGAAWEDVSRRYFDAGIPCPFLEDERCSVYEHRPVVCREYAVTSPPALCATLDPAIHAIDRPVHMDEALTGMCAEVAALPRSAIPLPLALEWAQAHGDRVRRAGDGEALFWSLLDEMGTTERA